MPLSFRGSNRIGSTPNKYHSGVWGSRYFKSNLWGFVNRFELLDSKEIPFITIEELIQNIDFSNEFEEVTEGKDPTKVDF